MFAAAASSLRMTNTEEGRPSDGNGLIADIWSVGWSADEPLLPGVGLPPSRQESRGRESRSSWQNMRSSQETSMRRRSQKTEMLLSADPNAAASTKALLEQDRAARRHRFSIALEQAQRAQEASGYSISNPFLIKEEDALDDEFNNGASAVLRDDTLLYGEPSDGPASPRGRESVMMDAAARVGRASRYTGRASRFTTSEHEDTALIEAQRRTGLAPTVPFWRLSRSSRRSRTSDRRASKRGKKVSFDEKLAPSRPGGSRKKSASAPPRSGGLFGLLGHGRSNSPPASKSTSSSGARRLKGGVLNSAFRSKEAEGAAADDDADDDDAAQLPGLHVPAVPLGTGSASSVKQQQRSRRRPASRSHPKPIKV